MRPAVPLRAAFVATLLLAATGCLPGHLKYTLVVESEPTDATVYDPRTDEVVGKTPYEIPLEYDLKGVNTYVRRPTAADQWTPQQPGEKKAHEVTVDAADNLRLLIVAPGHEKVEQTVNWNVTPYDNQTIKKRVYLKPIGTGTTLKPEDDVYR